MLTAGVPSRDAWPEPLPPCASSSNLDFFGGRVPSQSASFSLSPCFSFGGQGSSSLVSHSAAPRGGGRPKVSTTAALGGQPSRTSCSGAIIFSAAWNHPSELGSRETTSARHTRPAAQLSAQSPFSPSLASSSTRGSKVQMYSFVDENSRGISVWTDAESPLAAVWHSACHRRPPRVSASKRALLWGGGSRRATRWDVGRA